MRVHDLEIPSLLVDLIEAGSWAQKSDDVRAQNVAPLLGKEAARKLSPIEEQIVLMAPPFHTIGDELADGNEFWIRDLTNVGEIDYRRAVIIADFGLGTDSPIILYYPQGQPSPVVMYLRWRGDGPAVRHDWVQTHETFEQFAADVGLVTEL